MPVQKVDKIWMNGTMVNWDDAQIHVLSHVVHYGTSWFEGIRCYNTEKGPAIFRLDLHVRRLAGFAEDLPHAAAVHPGADRAGHPGYDPGEQDEGMLYPSGGVPRATVMSA